MSWRRHAVFWVPAPGAFHRAGAAWLGWDSRSGSEVARPGVPGLPASGGDVTQRPGRYGIHATLHAPFRLAEGATLDGLHEALAEFAATAPPAFLPGLRAARMGGFVALRPTGPGSVGRLEQALLRAIDRFRAPPAPEDYARRTRGLDAEGRALLDRWGYPHVMGRFNFHVTLTGRLPKEALQPAIAALQAHFAPVLPAPVAIGALSLMGEAEDRRFHEIARLPLTGGMS